MNAPGGCRWCGVEQRLHASRWTSLKGWHRYEHPPTALIKSRMQDRRTRDAP